MDRQKLLASVDWFLKWDQTHLFLFLAMIRGWCTKMEAKIEKRKKEGMHVVVFNFITFLSPGPHLLSYFFKYKYKLFRFKFSLRRCGQVSSTLPTFILYVNGEYYYVHYWSAANALSPIWFIYPYRCLREEHVLIIKLHDRINKVVERIEN